jgi:hypothetical protein
MALGRGLTSVRGNRGKKIVKNGPLVRQKTYKEKKMLTIRVPPPYTFDILICGESYIYVLNAEEQYTVSLSFSLMTHSFSLHHHLHHQQLHLPSSSYPE